MTASSGERDQQAAYWYLKLRETNVSAQEIQAGLDCVEASPENRAAFERVETYWRAWPDALPTGAAPVVSKARPQRMSVTRRTIAATAALAAAALLAWLAPNLWHLKGESQYLEYTTAIGEHRTVVLDDASQIVLGGATDMRSNFTAQSRRVELWGGEALFQVTSNPQRPFVVDMPNGSARALGTTFNINYGPDGTTIAVLDGIVRVDPRWGASSIQLPAGAQVLLSTDGRPGAITRADPRQVVAWNNGRLVFVDRSLRSVIADLNRYSTKPITLETASTGDAHVSGTVRLDAIKQWLDALISIAGVRLVESEHKFVLVAAKSAGAATSHASPP
jgi:transmembrane sensor